MERKDIYNGLVGYHATVSLDRCLSSLRGGVYHDSEGPLMEGFDRRAPAHNGFIIIANGDTLVGKLKGAGMVFDDLGGFVPVRNRESLFRYLEDNAHADGAYIFNGVDRSITRVSEVINNPASLPPEFDMFSMIPKDFVSYDGSVSNTNIGTKTRLAIRLPHAYEDTETFQVKRSPYGPTRMGKVTHFTRDGLKEEFFFDYQGGEVVGVYREYERDEERGLIRTLEKVVDIETIRRELEPARYPAQLLAA